METLSAKRLHSRSVRLISLVLALLVVLASCSSGMPTQAGEYELQKDTLTWNGSQYRFAWVDRDGSVKWAQSDDVKLVQDERTFLEYRDGEPIIHLTADTPVQVLARDRSGDFASSWLPFAVGAMLGQQTANNQPAYRYPPTDTFGRGDTLRGSTTTTRPQTGGVKSTNPIGDAISGQAGGTGGGSAATSKGTGAVSGQSGGTGSGSAATGKSGSGITGGKSSGGLSGARSSGGLRGRR